MHPALGTGAGLGKVTILIIRHEMIPGAWILRVNIMDSKNMLRNRTEELAYYVLTLIYEDHEHKYKEERITAHKRRWVDKAERLDPWSPEAPRPTLSHRWARSSGLVASPAVCACIQRVLASTPPSLPTPMGLT